MSSTVSRMLLLSYNVCESKKLELMRNGLVTYNDINAHDFFGNTPLHIAIQCGHYNFVKELLKVGVYVNVTNRFCNTPLDYAIHVGCAKVVKLLLDATLYE